MKDQFYLLQLHQIPYTINIKQDGEFQEVIIRVSDYTR